jgi:hypothetical protein
MTFRPEELRAELPSLLRWKPGPATDFIDMEWLISHIDNQKLRDQLMVIKLEAAAQILTTQAEAAQKAAGLIAGQL